LTDPPGSRNFELESEQGVGVTHLRLVPKVDPASRQTQPNRGGDWSIAVMIACLAVVAVLFVVGILDPGLRAR